MEQDRLRAALAFGSQTALGSQTPLCPEAEASLSALVRGNALYLAQERNMSNLTDLVRTKTAQEGQHPYAVVVCCADSRVPPEHIFHAGIGDLFVIRNAGNVMTPSALGSVEYAVGHLHVPLVLVMGHRGCGAVAAALLHGREPGALGDLVAQVSAAVGHCHDPRQAERANLLHSLAALGASEHLTLLAESGKVNFAAAIYDIRTGTVELCQDPQSP